MPLEVRHLLFKVLSNSDVYVLILDSLTDEHVLELSKRITSEEELMDLGIKVLGLPDFLIKTAFYDNREKMQPATHEILSRWLKQQNSRREAYINLHAGLKKCEMSQLAAELKLWVEGVSTSMAPHERRF